MITDKRFVTTWMTSKTLQEVATKLKTSKASASARATGLRTRGVALPVMAPDHNIHATTEELNELVAQYQK